VQGPDYGTVFVVTGMRVTIGRGDENDIVINDLKASRMHAELLTSAGGGWTVRDNGSANGIMHNGKVTRMATVRTADTLTVGESVLEFLASEAATLMLAAPPRPADQIRNEQAMLQIQKQRVRQLGAFGGGVMGLPSPTGSGGQSRSISPLTLLVLAGGAVLLLMDTDKPAPVKKKAQAPAAARDLASLLPPDVPEELNRTAEMFFKAGFREYREKNYLRAKAHFENVLQVAPGHRMAKLYLNNADREIEEEVKFHLDRGKKASEAGLTREAKGHYEAVLRLLHKDQASPSFIEAKEHLLKLEADS
jgi:hypothetical protein